MDGWRTKYVHKPEVECKSICTWGQEFRKELADTSRFDHMRKITPHMTSPSRGRNVLCDKASHNCGHRIATSCHTPMDKCGLPTQQDLLSCPWTRSCQDSIGPCTGASRRRGDFCMDDRMLGVDRRPCPSRSKSFGYELTHSGSRQ